ncbi:MAG: hypothetical protein L0K49_10505, partial [Lactococcus lactis]|nr:hypothetical protein [Lactococcus lactis]MDN6279070.1 hypothetical protein [Lactococcus lactis]MDN6506835.1 hypothetical protein [Lactococcus lactis]
RPASTSVGLNFGVSSFVMFFSFGYKKSTLIYSPGCFRTVPPDFRQLTTLILCHNFLEMTQPS